MTFVKNMKKLIHLLLLLMILMAGCKTDTSRVVNEDTVEEEPKNTYLFPEGFKASKNISEGCVNYIDAKVMQTLKPEEPALCLAFAKSDYGYSGDLILYWSDKELLYDDKIIKCKAVLIGTFTYKNGMGREVTVPWYIPYCEYEEYKEAWNEAYTHNPE